MCIWSIYVYMEWVLVWDLGKMSLQWSLVSFNKYTSHTVLKVSVCKFGFSKENSL